MAASFILHTINQRNRKRSYKCLVDDGGGGGVGNDGLGSCRGRFQSAVEFFILNLREVIFF